MPAAVTLDEAYDRLFDLMPGWMHNTHDSEWVRRWMQASGDSRATAYRMQDRAVELEWTIWELWIAGHGGVPSQEMFLAYCDHWNIPYPAWGQAAA